MLKEAAAATVAEAVKSVNEVAANFSLDNLQDEFGANNAIYEGLDVTYLTPRVIAMGFPCTPDTKIRSRNDAASVAMLLKERHDGHFMIWNLAEEAYDYSLFDNQVRLEAIGRWRLAPCSNLVACAAVRDSRHHATTPPSYHTECQDRLAPLSHPCR